MAIHNDTGKEGEDLAVDFLLDKGFHILHRNWRYGSYEIDIIALQNQTPHFVEVKTRTSSGFALPEVSVDRRKTQLILRAATGFMTLHPQYKDFRIDILSIVKRSINRIEYFYIEDVYP